jgi:hypothetical protein
MTYPGCSSWKPCEDPGLALAFRNLKSYDDDGRAWASDSPVEAVEHRAGSEFPK